jgi:hypothetical protein
MDGKAGGREESASWTKVRAIIRDEKLFRPYMHDSRQPQQVTSTWCGGS